MMKAKTQLSRTQAYTLFYSCMFDSWTDEKIMWFIESQIEDCIPPETVNRAMSRIVFNTTNMTPMQLNTNKEYKTKLLTYLDSLPEKYNEDEIREVKVELDKIIAGYTIEELDYLHSVGACDCERINPQDLMLKAFSNLIINNVKNNAQQSKDREAEKLRLRRNSQN